MGSAVERLTNLVDAKDRHDIPLAELLSVQIEAANERLNERVGAIRLLANRAETAGIRKISSRADIVPLLFAHTAYKSYPEAWLSQGKWDRMGQWLDTVSTHRVKGVDTAGISDIDEWLERLAANGHFISCSSGTTGKVSMINSSMADRTFNKRVAAASFEWATGLPADRSRKVFACNPSSNNYRHVDTRAAYAEAFGDGESTYVFPGLITVGQVRRMVTLRRSIADGTAKAADIAAYEATSAERQKVMDGAATEIAHAMIAKRGEKLLIIGMFALLFRIAETVQSLGYSGKDFHPDNALMVGGGLKGAVLPPDYRERILSTFSIQEEHVYHMYGMQEINTHFPRCKAGRYHTAPWMMLLPLDATGDNLIEPTIGEVEGRAAFFDLSYDAQWGGIISGDRIKVQYGKCACGHEGPTVGPDIVRYADLEGGDKISCAGTIDAYVRGVT
jgi:hypothetical protein